MGEPLSGCTTSLTPCFMAYLNWLERLTAQCNCNGRSMPFYATSYPTSTTSSKPVSTSSMAGMKLLHCQSVWEHWQQFRTAVAWPTALRFRLYLCLQMCWKFQLKYIHPVFNFKVDHGKKDIIAELHIYTQLPPLGRHSVTTSKNSHIFLLREHFNGFQLDWQTNPIIFIQMVVVLVLVKTLGC